VVVAHTRDDQAETVLLKLLRGAGARGLGGIHPSVGRIVRPLLDVGRQELREWLRSQGHSWVEDATNEDIAVQRNRMRHRVLPGLGNALGTDVEAALARCAEISRADAEWLDALTTDACAGLVQADATGFRIDRDALARQPLALQRRVLLQVLRQAGAVQPGFADVERLRELVNGATTSVQVSGRIRVERIGQNGVLVGRAMLESAAVGDYHYDLPVPGHIAVAGTEWAVSAELADAALPMPVSLPNRQPIAQIDAATTESGLAVRNWRPGDWMRPLGLGGRKKLQDVFVDGKLPRQTRRRLPLVVDAHDQVVWVPGLAIHDAARVTADTKAVVVLTMFQVGGPA
jgi:tRNA(Ile)-lysidine synthase